MCAAGLGEQQGRGWALQGSVAGGSSLGAPVGLYMWHCPSLATMGDEPLAVPQRSRKAAAAAPSQPLMVPLSRTYGPGCHQGSVPSALAGADRRTQRGAGGGRKLLIPLYLPLALLSHLPVTLSVSPGISRSYSCASLAAGGLPTPHSTPWAGTGPGLPHPSSRMGSLTPSPGSAGLTACRKHQP